MLIWICDKLRDNAVHLLLPIELDCNLHALRTGMFRGHHQDNDGGLLGTAIRETYEETLGLIDLSNIPFDMGNTFVRTASQRVAEDIPLAACYSCMIAFEDPTHLDRLLDVVYDQRRARLSALERAKPAYDGRSCRTEGNGLVMVPLAGVLHAVDALEAGQAVPPAWSDGDVCIAYQTDLLRVLGRRPTPPACALVLRQRVPHPGWAVVSVDATHVVLPAPDPACMARLTLAFAAAARKPDSLEGRLMRLHAHADTDLARAQETTRIIVELGVPGPNIFALEMRQHTCAVSAEQLFAVMERERVRPHNRLLGAFLQVMGRDARCTGSSICGVVHNAHAFRYTCDEALDSVVLLSALKALLAIAERARATDAPVPPVREAHVDLVWRACTREAAAPASASRLASRILSMAAVWRRMARL